MNGVHDMGGMHGFGAVDVEDAAQFHDQWERIVFAMDKAIKAQGIANVDQKRHAIERMDQAAYLQATYFERWLSAVERMLADADHLTETEVESRLKAARAATDPAELVPDRTDPSIAETIRAAFEAAAAYDREPKEPAFAEGEAVRVRTMHPKGHTRSPRYARRARGEIDAIRGTFVYPDASAHGEERAEPLYGVAFTAGELWGPDADRPDDVVHLDLWEPYLETA